MKRTVIALGIILLFSTLFNLLAIRHCGYLEASHEQARKASEIARDAMELRATRSQITARIQTEFAGKAKAYQEDEGKLEGFVLPKNDMLIGGSAHWAVHLKFDAQGKCERAWIKHYYVGGF